MDNEQLAKFEQTAELSHGKEKRFTHHVHTHIPGEVFLLLTIAIVMISLIVLVAWAVNHPADFVSTSSLLVHGAIWMLTLGATIGLVWLAIRVIVHPLIEAGHRVTDMVGKIKRHRVHVAHENYAVVDGVFHQVSQERHNYSYKGEIAPQDVLQLPAPAESRIPTFTELLDQGIIQQSLQRGKMLIGFVFDAGSNTWVPRFGSWLDLYSCAIAGVIGSGKTTTALFLLLQALLAGAKMVLIDPHLHDPEESLAERLSMFRGSMVFPPCDDTPADILERTRWLFNEYKRRKALGIKGPALIVVYEEFNACMRNPEVAKEIAELLTIIEQEARKFGIFAILIGQYWSAQGIGNAVIRQCLASALVHRMSDIEQAKKLLGIPKKAQSVLQLEQGHYVFRDTNGGYEETVTPHIVESDLLDVARLVLPAAHETSAKPGRNQPETTMQDLADNPLRNQSETSVRNQSEQALQARARDIIKLQSDGKSKPEIMRLLWGVSPGKNDAYERANEEFTDAMKLIHQLIGEEA